jgi:hypothetical protein
MRQAREFVRLACGACLFAAIGCFGNGCSDPNLGARVRCQLDAIKILPKDPLNATVYDAVDVISRLRACESVSSEITVDGGKT